MEAQPVHVCNMYVSIEIYVKSILCFSFAYL